MQGDETGHSQDGRLAGVLLSLTRELLARSISADFYGTILDHALELVPGAQAGSLLVRDDDGRYRFAAARGFDLDALSTVTFSEAEVRADLGDGERAVIIRAIDDRNRTGLDHDRVVRLRQHGATTRIRSTLAVPVVLDGTIAASFRLDSLRDEHAFGPTSLRLAEALGQHIGAVIRRLWLQQRAEEAARALALRADVERMLVANDDLRAFFPALTARLARDLPVHGTVVVQLRPWRRVMAFDAAGARLGELEEALEDGGALLAHAGGADAEVALGRRWRSLSDGECLPGPTAVPAPIAAAEVATLHVDGAPWGELAFFSTRPGAFTPRHRSLLASLVDGIELELQQEVKRERLASQVEQLRSLVHVSDAIATAADVDEVAHHVLAAVVRTVEADSASLLTVEPGGGALRVVRAQRRDGSALVPSGAIVPSGGAFAWRVLEHDGVLAARGPGAAGDAALLSALNIDAAAAIVGVPLRGQHGDAIGVLLSAMCRPGADFDDQRLGFVEAAAQAAGSALVRIELLETSRAQARDHHVLYQAAQRQAEELAVLDELRSAVARELELDEVIRKAVEDTARLIGKPMVSVYMVVGEELVLKHGVGHARLPERLPLDRGVMGRVARSGVAELVRDVRTDPDFVSTGEDVQREVAVPLMAEGRVLGVLNAESVEGDLDELDARLLASIAEQVSIAIQRARLHDSVRDSERRFRLLAEHMSDMVCLHDPDGAFTYVSPSSKVLVGYEAGELLGLSPLDLVHEEDRELLIGSFRELASTGVAGESVSYRVRDRAGRVMWLETTAQPVLGDDGAVVGVVTSSRDATERKTFEARLVQGALYDDLTGLPNRVLLTDRLEQALERHRRDDRNAFALLFIDLDRFKVVNDSLGHSVGDALLSSLGARLRTLVRKVDTVARLGGDEFCILVEDLASPKDAVFAAQRVHEALREPFEVQGRALYTTASIGIAHASTVYGTPDEVLRDADLAMYRAKHDGRARHAVFDVGMHARAVSRLELETELRQGLLDGALDVAYQPIVELATGRLAGVEALVRWQHPARGMVPPAEFIPMAEETGLVAAIDRFVLREACRQVADWRRLGGGDLEVSVNVSPIHFSAGDLGESVEDALHASALPPEALKLEITETVVMTDPELVSDVLQRLRERGTLVQIDDFGTGYSSLGMLKRLPIDSLKVDRSFVAGVSDDESARGIVTAVLDLARNLGIDVVAEGIETSEQLEFLRSVGCEYGQGYLFSAPLSAVAFEAAGWITAAAT